MSLLTLEFEQIVFMKVLGNCLSFPTNKIKNRCIWTFRTRDMGLTLNSVWATGHIQTSFLMIRFGLLKDRIESWTPMNVFRPMS
jgi:hypothetical protein